MKMYFIKIANRYNLSYAWLVYQLCKRSLGIQFKNMSDMAHKTSWLTAEKRREVFFG
jgi:hypothetical protein